MTRLGCLVEASQELEALSRPGSAVQKQTGEVNWGQGHRDHPPEHWQGGGWGWGGGKMSYAQEIRGRSGEMETQSPFFLSLATTLSISTSPCRSP